MGGVPNQRHRAGAAAERLLAVVERPFEPLIGDRDQCASLLGPGPTRKVAQDFHDDVDEAAAFDRVVDQMCVLPKPQMHQRLAEFRRHGLGGHQCAPGGAVTETGRTLAMHQFADIRPNPVGADQRDAAFVQHLARAAGLHGDAFFVGDEIFDPGAELERNVLFSVRRVGERGL